MKRIDLVQLCIVITGICSAFFFIELLPTFGYYLLTWFSSGLSGGYVMEGFIQTIIMMTTYLLFSLLSISNSKQLASWVGNKANLNGDINFALSVKDLLFALLIVLGIYGLIKELPQFLSNLYHYFKEDPHYMTNPDPSRPSGERIFIQVAKIALSIIVLAYANVFAQFFVGKMKTNDEPDDSKLTSP